MEMKQSMQISAVVIFTLLAVFPLAALSEIKITLKNGRDIIADSCSDSKDRLVCEKMGGTFEIDQKDILNIKGITIERSEQVPEEKKEQEAAAAGKAPVEPEADLKGAEKQPQGNVIKDLGPEDAKRLDQITQRKLVLQQEREKLIKERQQLHDDVKNMEVIRDQAQLDALKNRISDLETRINAFHEEVKKLNEEEQEILDSSKNKQ